MNSLKRTINFVSESAWNVSKLHKCIMRDDTMTGVIEPGSEVIVDVSAINFYEDGIYLFNYEGVLNIKRLQFLKDGIKVIPNNGHYISYLINDGFEKLVILGRVVSTRRMECWS